MIWCCVRDVACEREARLWPTLLQIPLQTLVFQEALDLTTDRSRHAISTRTIGATSTVKEVHNLRAWVDYSQIRNSGLQASSQASSRHLPRG